MYFPYMILEVRISMIINILTVGVKLRKTAAKRLLFILINFCWFQLTMRFVVIEYLSCFLVVRM
jgi:hypothetical protein